MRVIAYHNKEFPAKRFYCLAGKQRARQPSGKLRTGSRRSKLTMAEEEKSHCDTAGQNNNIY